MSRATTTAAAKKTEEDAATAAAAAAAEAKAEEEALLKEKLEALLAAEKEKRSSAADAALLRDLRGRVYTRAEAKEIGMDQHKEFKCKTAAYIKTDHVFEVIDEIKDNRGKVIRQVYGNDIHTGESFEDCMARPQDFDNGPTLCAVSKAKKSVNQWGPATNAGRRDRPQE